MNATLIPPHPGRPRLAARWLELGRESARNGARRLAGLLAAALHAVDRRGHEALFGQLLYHRVAPWVRGVPRPSMNVRPERFAAQLSGLLEQGYGAWPLPRLLAASQQRAIPPRTLSLTFDDGFESVYHHAWPVLVRYQQPATVFLTTAYLDGEGPFFFDRWALDYQRRVPPEAYRPLRRAQCREMADSGLVTFGAHLHTHRDWRGQPDAFRRDLQRSVEIVSELTNGPPILFAFPFGKSSRGYVSDELVEAARAAGVHCGMTTDSVTVQPGDDPFRWGRFNVYDWDTPRTLAARLAGCYGVAGMRRMLTGGRTARTLPAPLPREEGSPT
ncbi:MAG: polysaccharide deacetylase family protein [Pirellulaceae bacterium]|nr:polysaccharide deacetylase family protein [Pirellulaceae bacterium]